MIVPFAMLSAPALKILLEGIVLYVPSLSFVFLAVSADTNNIYARYLKIQKDILPFLHLIYLTVITTDLAIVVTPFVYAYLSSLPPILMLHQAIVPVLLVLSLSFTLTCVLIGLGLLIAQCSDIIDDKFSSTSDDTMSDLTQPVKAHCYLVMLAVPDSNQGSDNIPQAIPASESRYWDVGELYSCTNEDDPLDLDCEYPEHHSDVALLPSDPDHEFHVENTLSRNDLFSWSVM